MREPDLLHPCRPFRPRGKTGGGSRFLRYGSTSFGVESPAGEPMLFPLTVAAPSVAIAPGRGAGNEEKAEGRPLAAEIRWRIRKVSWKSIANIIPVSRNDDAGFIAFGGVSDDNTWMVTFTDLALLMLTFFVMLFAMSNVKSNQWDDMVDAFSRQLNLLKQKQIAAATAEYTISTVYRRRAIDLDYLVSVLEKIIRDDDVLAQSNLVRHDDRLLIALPGDLLFQPGSAILAPEAERTLFNLGGILRNIGNAVAINGHTDPTRPMAGPIRRIGNFRPPAPSRSPIFYAVRGMPRILPRLDLPIVCLRDCRMCRTRIGNGWDVASISWFWKRSGGSDVVAPFGEAGRPYGAVRLHPGSCHFRHWPGRPGGGLRTTGRRFRNDCFPLASARSLYHRPSGADRYHFLRTSGGKRRFYEGSRYA